MVISIACYQFKQNGGIERYTLDLIKGFNLKNIKFIPLTLIKQ